jgi:hypothetical protein
LKRANLYRFTPGALVEAGINKAKPNLAKGGRGEKEEAEAQLKEIFGGDWEILQAQLHAQEKSPNPFHIINPALTWEQARNLVKARAEILKAGVAMRAVRARKAEVGKIEEFNLSFDNAVQELRAVAGKKADEIPELQELRGAKKAGSVSEMKKNLGMLARAHARMKLG